jgi:hypothetical protein
MHAQSKTIWLFEIFIWDSGQDTENTDHGPDMGFYGPLVNQSE